MTLSDRSKYSFPVLLLLCLFCLHCAASPKYRNTASPYVPPADVPERRSGTSFSVPNELWDTKSLQTIYGVASWYGPNFHGRKTANGETYDMNGNSAAHKELPFNTWVRVTNMKNNRVILTRINDRGPFVKGRVLDLSKGAAEALDMLIDGIADVKIEIVKWGERRQ